MKSLQPVERYHPRVSANFMVKVLVNGRTLLAKACDLSMAGLRLIAPFSARHRRLTVAIPLPGEQEILTSCRVSRATGDGVAVEFNQLDWDDLLTLARFLHPRL